MSVTILGQHIRVIRPEKINKPIVRKCDLPKATYNKRARTNKERSGRVEAVTVKLKDGTIKSLAKGIHLDVLAAFNINIKDVAEVGWILETEGGGFKFIWR